MKVERTTINPTDHPNKHALGVVEIITVNDGGAIFEVRKYHDRIGLYVPAVHESYQEACGYFEGQENYPTWPSLEASDGDLECFAVRIAGDVDNLYGSFWRQTT